LTDAKKLGYSLDDIQIAAAHTDVTTTQDYIRDHDKRVSKVHLPMPPKAKA
jgi:integrase